MFSEHQDTEHKIPEGPRDVWLTRLLGAFDWVEGPRSTRPVGKLGKL